MNWALKMPGCILNLFEGLFASPENEYLVCVTLRTRKSKPVVLGHSSPSEIRFWVPISLRVPTSDVVTFQGYGSRNVRVQETAGLELAASRGWLALDRFEHQL
jgi:hypothetical protein